MSVRRNEAQVIDLRDYRQRRAVTAPDAPTAAAPAAPVPVAAPIAWMPVFVLFPVWLIR